jgi:hypothetical protein
VTAPFGLATKLLLRLLLPGALLAAAFSPIIYRLREMLSLQIDTTILFCIAALALGWLLLLLLDMPIYMAFEGRRYWPGWFRKLGLWHERRRLAGYVAKANAAKAAGDGAMQKEFRVRASHFPASPTGDFEVWYPTRLGNLLAAFEQYPERKYGLDGVFFWYRIWVSIDQELREELDNAQALVDGALYAVFSFFVCAVMSTVYGLIATYAVPFGLPHGATPTLFFALSASSLLLSVSVYRSGLHAQAQYGELFKSVFDQHRFKLNLAPLLEDMEKHLPSLTTTGKVDRDRNRAAWRFLRWHRFRPDGSRTNEIVKGW